MIFCAFCNAIANGYDGEGSLHLPFLVGEVVAGQWLTAFLIPGSLMTAILAVSPTASTSTLTNGRMTDLMLVNQMPYFQDTFKSGTTGAKVSVIFSLYTVSVLFSVSSPIHRPWY